jgi:hypothetical protein
LAKPPSGRIRQCNSCITAASSGSDIGTDQPGKFRWRNHRYFMFRVFGDYS